MTVMESKSVNACSVPSAVIVMELEIKSMVNPYPLIAISSLDTPDLQSRAFEAGFAVFRPKHDLQGLVDSIVGLCTGSKENAG